MSLRSGTFRSGDLRRIDASRSVVLASGGPLMEVVRVAGDVATRRRGDREEVFPISSLRSLVAFDPSPWRS